jgi:gliding motility-associated-like protein
VSWSLTGGNAYRQQRNDSTIAISFMQSGTYQLIARLGQTCETVNDTITIQVSVPGQLPPLNLGPADTLLCTNNTILLNAHSGYASYVWQDASVDSVYTVTQPGTYYVTVTDACGGTQSDTIRVQSYFPGVFSLGLDRVKCNADTIHINSTAGFINYQWMPAYNINTVLNQNVIVYPYVDTTYTVMAEKFPGCFVYDTVHVTVNHSPAINLGPDKNLCGGDNTIADAGPGFSQYLWSTGAITRQITLSSSGTYSVAATYTNGCVSKDTLAIAAFPNPLVTLDKTSTLCMGETRLLDAGNFSSYLWNDASTQRTLLVNGTGIYYVTITDANGCRDTDSTEIKTLLPLPVNFLPGDTSLCMYSSIQLIAASGYSGYLWSDNSNNPTLSVTQAGLYWLEVKDNNGCKGRDTIHIATKQCLRGIFVPNAFTPNGDSKNDLFKPSIFGTVKQYEFIVYNQYGSIVFRTNNPSVGWDGSIKGKMQNQGTYTWVCIYRVDNQLLTTEQGSVVLIR